MEPGFLPGVPLGCLGMRDQDHCLTPRPFVNDSRARTGAARGSFGNPMQESNAGSSGAVPAGGKLPAAGSSTARSLLPWSHLALFDGGFSARSTRRSTQLHGLPSPILSVNGQRLAQLLWYCCCDLFLLSGCTHRCCDGDNRYRRQSDYHFAYHGTHSSFRTRTPPFNVKLNSSDAVASVRQYRAVSPEIAP
jgi:hypothetical protein